MEETYAPRQVIYLHLDMPVENPTKQIEIKTTSMSRPYRLLSNICLKKTPRSKMIKFNTGYSASLKRFILPVMFLRNMPSNPFNATWVITVLLRSI